MTQTLRLLTITSVLLLASCASTMTWSEADNLNFPQDYLGTWTGPMQILKDGQVNRELTMTLTISPKDDDRYTWILTYIDRDHVDVRPYELQVVDKSKGQYEIDELNSIILPLQRSGNRLTSWFSVMGQQLQITYSLCDKHIDFHVHVSRTDPGSVTGDGVIEGDTIPAVGVYPILITQRGRMKRVKGSKNL